MAEAQRIRAVQPAPQEEGAEAGEVKQRLASPSVARQADS